MHRFALPDGGPAALSTRIDRKNVRSHLALCRFGPRRCRRFDGALQQAVLDENRERKRKVGPRSQLDLRAPPIDGGDDPRARQLVEPVRVAGIEREIEAISSSVDVDA